MSHHKKHAANLVAPKLRKTRRSLLRSAMMAAIGMGVFAMTNAYAAGLITTTGIQTLMATETVNGSTQQTAVSVGPLTNNAGSTNQTGLQSGVDSSSLAVVPINQSLGTTVYSSNQAAASAVSGYLQNYLQTIANAVVGSMKSSSTSIQLGMFTYIQNVQIANPAGGSPTTAQVYATVQVQPNGSYQYLGANVNNNTLFLLYAIYQQSKDAAYLPAGWTVPYAGETQWELTEVTIEGNTEQASPIAVNGSVWHVIQDNGAYDGIETVTNGVEKINYAPGAASWIKNQITPLMNQYNASIGVAMYGEQVKVSRSSSGQPLTAISVNSRVLDQSCSSQNTFVNTGQYGYLLTESENEYIVQPGGSYSDAGQFQENTISPTQSYTESASVPSSVNSSQLWADVVFPIAPDAGDLINWQSGSPLPASDYVYVAPLQTSAQGGGNTEINSYVGPMNVCVGSQNYVSNSPEYSACFGNTKNGCAWAPMHTEVEFNPLMINGNYDGVAGFSFPQAVGAFYLNPFLSWNPTTYMYNLPMITGGLNSFYIDDQNGWWSTGGVYYYDYAWNSPSAPQNVQSDYVIAATPNSGAYYSCTQSGCTYIPPSYGYGVYW